MTLKDLGDAMAAIPDDVLFARLRALGFTVGDQGDPLDLDRMYARANHEDWWNGEGD
jgi:hypothetical protein